MYQSQVSTPIRDAGQSETRKMERCPLKYSWVTVNGSGSQKCDSLPTLACLWQLLGKRSPEIEALASQQATQCFPYVQDSYVSPVPGPEWCLSLPLTFLPFS